MNGWMIAAIALSVAAAALAVFCFRMRKQLKERDARDVEMSSLQQETYALRGENARARREIAALYRALEEEQDRSDAFEEAYNEQRSLLHQAGQQADRAEARRIEAEKDIYAGRMRISLLEQQIEAMQREQLAQEQLYQDILREKEETIFQLQNQQPKYRPKKKNDLLEQQQVTLDDILGTF